MKKGNYKNIEKQIEKYENIFVFHHIRPDGDCLGAQHGLALAIRKRFPKKNTFLIGDTEGALNFMNFYIDDESKIDKKYFENSLAIVVDTADIKRIQKGDLITSGKFSAAIKIDHHPLTNNEEIYTHSWVDTSFVAASEMIGYFLMSNKWKIDAEIAQYVYLGILTDSGRFLFASTSARTFKVAAFLMKTGFDFAKLNWYLAKKSQEEIDFTAHVLSNYKKEGKVIWFHVTKRIQDKFKLKEEQAVGVNMLANIGDSRIWIFFIDTDGMIRVRIRSNGPIVNQIAVEHGGGGHALAAGITIQKRSQIKQIVDRSVLLVKEFEENENRK
ncbi:DHH family phosphoesterase [Mesomycoplasma conjunctivae]|uniref:DHH family phosphoesterase n=1 Tax=Mesomycoplasma conjunctivae TaxID=45361 RepID=UPI003DA4DBB2